MKTKDKKRYRLYGKQKAKLPMPVKGKKDKGFSLRSIEEADSRYAVVKTMRNRLQQLKDKVNTDTVGKEWLAGRAVFLLAYCETQETNAMEGTNI